MKRPLYKLSFKNIEELNNISLSFSDVRNVLNSEIKTEKTGKTVIDSNPNLIYEINNRNKQQKVNSFLTEQMLKIQKRKKAIFESFIKKKDALLERKIDNREADYRISVLDFYNFFGKENIMITVNDSILEEKYDKFSEEISNKLYKMYKKREEDYKNRDIETENRKTLQKINSKIENQKKDVVQSYIFMKIFNYIEEHFEYEEPYFEKLNEKVKLKDFADNKNNILSNDTVSYLNEIVKAGFKERASDIHIKFDLLEGMEIKYRVDGYLMESQQLYETVNKKVLEKNITEIIARIKILAGMNVAEKRKPQDGSFSFLFNIKNLNKRYDIRAAYMPTIGGETMVLRILENYLENINLETLGFSNQSIAMLKEILTRKYGMILVSGPTGSGKSTTLKSLITMLNDGRKKIITVEDPVESKIEGIVQVQVNQNIGVTFAEVLKATLRNDPDIIVISEIRDEVTAEIAVRAALTGHLVISTIHTNDAVSTLIRLVDMGIPKYLILDSLIGVIGQRLVGKKCQKCMGEGCSECSNGYSGRISINEVLVLNQDVRNILKEDNHLGSETKNKLKMLNQKSKNQKHFIDFMEDADEKIEKNLIFEREKTSIIF